MLLQEPAEKSLRCFLEFLNLNRDDWDVLRLEKVPRKLIEYTNFDELFKQNAFSHICADSLNSPYTEITGSWEEYYTTRSKKFRKVMRNKLNRMRRDGLLQMERLSGSQVAGDVLNEIFDASKQSWKGQLNKSIRDDARVETFYRTLTNAFGPAGKVDLWLMRRNGKVIAFEYHLKHQGVTYPIRADFDESYHSLSPGSLLEFFIMKHLFDDPTVCGSNSCGATYEYLMDWATEVIERVKLLVFNSRKYSRNLFLLESKILPMAKRAKILGIQ
jgi:CelD/BcsL family acetyltransferase involved in cellulose biosynthesis